MPLIVGGDELCSQQNCEALQNLDTFLTKYEKVFDERNSQLKNQTVLKVVRSDKCLYVNQGELATIGPTNQNFSAMGTDMMTTCHTVVLRHPKTNSTSLAHFDGSAAASGVRQMVHTVKQNCLFTSAEDFSSSDMSLDLHIIGGFDDDRAISEKLSMMLLNEFSSLQVDFCKSLQIHLKTFCCTSLNQHVVRKDGCLVNSPILFGAGVVIATGEIFPAVFDVDAKGPVSPLRGALSLHGPQEMYSIFDWEKSEVVIHPFTFEPFPGLTLWLEQTDDFILTHMSTSPEVEPDNFVFHIRESLLFIKNNPDPMVTVFKDGQPLKFRKEDSEWSRL